MSASGALALNCRALEKDLGPASDLTVSCASCDPDNPRAVPRRSCKRCRGTGQSPVGLVSVIEEIQSSRLELLTGGKDRRRSRSDYDD